MARTNLQIKVGTYTGNGVDDRNITGIGFLPDLVIVKGGANVACIRTKEMRRNMSISMASAVASVTNQIQEFLSDGFQVGTAGEVNTNGTTYYYIAMRGVAGQRYFRTGNYRGTGADNRDFTVGGLDFTPDVVGIFGDTTQNKVWRSSSMIGDLTAHFLASEQISDAVQNLQSNGFQLGANAAVNGSAIEYFFFAMKALAGVMAVGSYTGNGTDNRNITGLGFQPDVVILKNNQATNVGRLRTSSMATDADGSYLTAGAPSANEIQSMLSDGFQVGSADGVNGNGQTFYYWAFKAGNFNVPIVRTAA